MEVLVVVEGLQVCLVVHRAVAALQQLHAPGAWQQRRGRGWRFSGNQYFAGSRDKVSLPPLIAQLDQVQRFFFIFVFFFSLPPRASRSSFEAFWGDEARRAVHSILYGYTCTELVILTVGALINKVRARYVVYRRDCCDLIIFKPTRDLFPTTADSNPPTVTNIFLTCCFHSIFFVNRSS